MSREETLASNFLFRIEEEKRYVTLVLWKEIS